jgi:hypothetical protein
MNTYMNIYMRTINMHYSSFIGKLVLVGLAISLTACHATVGTQGAIREYYRGLNGTVEQAKASPDRETAYWQTQKLHDGLKLGGQ